MNPRKPPRLATWLLNRFGVARQNPPLAGDLLEEFRSGRSAAWYCRQTLVAIFTGLVGNARLFRRLLTAYILGWAAEAGAAFALWWFHYPRQPHGTAGLIAWVVAVVFAICWTACAKVLVREQRARSSAEILESWSELEESTAEQRRVSLLRMFAGVTFGACLIAYCVFALLLPVPLWAFLGIQAELLLVMVANVLADPDPGPSKILTTLK